VVPLAFIAQQAKRRLEFLDYLDRLASDPKTTGQQMHHALVETQRFTRRVNETRRLNSELRW